MINMNIDVYTLIKPQMNKLKKNGIKNANLDCRLLLSKSLDTNKTLHNHQNINISENEIKNFQSLVEQRLNGKPISRIINKRYFWKHEFKLNEETLDPRPDSETIIDSVLDHYKNKSKSLKILDLGSGSGCLGLSLLNEYQNSEVSFFDTSKKSLELVKINALNHGFFDRSKFVHLDWRVKGWDINLIEIEDQIKFDIVISNPPYIPTNDIKTLQIEVKKYDPFIALNGGYDGLDSYRFIIPKLRKITKNNGKVFLEIGKGQENFISSKAKEHNLLPIEYKKDLLGVYRVLVFNVK